jgi:pimeloyl-ACP methyl ester carboxylesterase
LPAIRVPVMEICPYNAADVPKSRPMTEADKTAYYRELLKGTPSVEVMAISPARHFVMVDQPEAFAKALTQFLTAVPAKATTRPATNSSGSDKR